MSSGLRPKENAGEEKLLQRGATVAILKQFGADTVVTEVARRRGIRANTIRQWRDKDAGLETAAGYQLFKELGPTNFYQYGDYARQFTSSDVPIIPNAPQTLSVRNRPLVSAQ